MNSAPHTLFVRLKPGHVVVPAEPTDAMWESHWKALRLSKSELRAWMAVESLRQPGPHESGCVTAWRRMLAAAPTPETIERQQMVAVVMDALRKQPWFDGNEVKRLIWANELVGEIIERVQVQS